jgi:hypothetical protein
MLVVVWEYRAKAERTDDFESFYRPDGPWGDLFRQSPAFVSTTLMKDLRDAKRFIVAGPLDQRAALRGVQARAFR